MNKFLLLLFFCTSVSANDCADTANTALLELNKLDPVAESNILYCSGKPTLKRFVGYETLLLGVPTDFDLSNITVEDIGYSDAVLCEEEFLFFAAENKYIRDFNQNMLRCLENGNQCCSDINKQ
jgi:hypothetical protein